MEDVELVNPMFAEIVKEDEGCITARLVLFGRDVNQVFYGDNRGKCATEWVNLWNDHFAVEWLKVKETTSLVMETFCEVLMEKAVPESTLQNALEEVVQRVQG